MKQGLIGVCIALCFCIGVYWLFFLRVDVPIANYPPKNSTIVVFGDSLVAGYGSTPGNDFPSLLGASLKQSVINMGINGDTSADGLLRIDAVVAEEPGVVIVLLGGNDYLRRIDESATRANLSGIVEILKNSGSVVILAGVRRGIIRDGSDELYESIADTYGALYVSNVLDGIFMKPELMYDAIHPNDRGYALIADRFRSVFVDYALVRTTP